MKEILTTEQILKYLQYLETGKIPLHKAKRKLTSVVKFAHFLKQQNILSQESFETFVNFVQEKTNFKINLDTKDVTLSYKHPLVSLPQDILNRPFKINKEIVGKVNSQAEGTISPANAIHLTPQRLLGGLMLILFLVGIGMGLYTQFIKKTITPFAYPALPTTPNSSNGRVLSFQGRLTDSLGNPITSAVSVQYAFYTVSSGGSAINTQTCTNVTPDQDGVFNSLIGQDTGCATQIPNSIFTENPVVYMGVKVASDPEMTPRQQIANVGYAVNSETLQGLPPGSNASNIPIISQQGNLLVSAATPAVRSTYVSETFVISGAAAVTMQSAGSGDVSLIASQSGAIKLTTGATPQLTVANSGAVTLASLGTGLVKSTSGLLANAVSGTDYEVPLTFNNGLTRTSNTISLGGTLTGATTIANAGNNFNITGSGNVGIGTTGPNQKLTVDGTFGILETGTSPTYHTIFQGGDQAADLTYTLPTANVTNGFLQNNGSGVLSWATSLPSGTVLLNQIGAAAGTNTINNADYNQEWDWNSLTTGPSFTFGSNSTAGTASGTSKVLNIARSGTNTNTAHTAYGIYDTVTNTNATSGTNIAAYFSASGATTANYAAIFANGSVGIGITNPAAKLDLSLASTSTTGATEKGSQITVADTGIVTTGTDTTYGNYNSVTRTGATGGTINTFGDYITVTGDTGGTSTATGLGVNVSGADTNYAATFSGGNVGIGTTTPAASLDVAGDINAAKTITTTTNSNVNISTTSNLSATGSVNGLTITPTLGGTAAANTYTFNAINLAAVAGSCPVGATCNKYGLNFAGTGYSADLKLQNGATIDNATSGQLYLVASTVKIGGKLNVSTNLTSGNFISAGATSATTVAGAIIGSNVDLSTNYTTANGFAITGYNLLMPALTQTTAVTTAYTGFNLGTSGAVVQNTLGGTINWTGLNLQMPNQTQTTGTVKSTGIAITGGTVTSGTAYALTTTASAGNVGIGTTAPGAALDVAGNILVNNGGTIDTRAAGTLTIGGSTQTGLNLGRSGQTTKISNLTTNGPVYTSGSDGTLNSEVNLAVVRGGTGAGTFTAHGVLLGQGTSAITAITPPGTANNCLLSTASSDPVWGACTTGGGVVTSVTNGDGTLTISPTTGAVIASLNLGNANTWTALQTYNTGVTVANNSNLTQTGSGTFGTGTGAVSLNGDTTIATGKNFTLASGTGIFTQTYTPAGTTTSATGATFTPTFGINAAAQTLTGILVNPNTNSDTDAGDALYGINLDNITGTAASETALRIGAGYDNLIEFEGATNNSIETFLTATDPTSTDKTINFPNASGTVAVSASGVIALDALGNITCPTCGTGGGSVTSISQGNGIALSPNPITTTGSVAVDQTYGFTFSGNDTFSPTTTNDFTFNLDADSTLFQTFSSATTSTVADVLSVTNSASTGTVAVRGQDISLVGTSSSGSNTITGVNFSNVTTQTNNTFNGITFGTGFNNLLTTSSGALNIAATGVITGTGATWNGTTIGTTYGGTGQNFSGSVQGSIPYFSGTGTMATLPPGTSGYVLTSGGTGANPSWTAASSIGPCSTCVITNPSSNQIIAATGTTTGLSIQKSSTGTADVFTVTDNAGTNKYLAVTSAGNVTSTGTIFGEIFKDLTGTSYGLDPGSNSFFSGYSLATYDGAYIAQGAATAYGLLVGNGNVGIGITTPAAKLDLSLASTSTTGATEYGTRNTVSDTGIVTTGTDTTYGNYNSVTRTGATGGTINTFGDYITVTADNAGAGTSTATGLAVNVTGADTNYAATFSGGNVGIGTTTPTFGLEVGGTARIDGNTTIGDASGDSATFNAATLSLANASTLDLVNSSVSSLNIESGLMNFDTSNSRIGIGTTTPGYKLDVNGTANISGTLNTAGEIYNSLAGQAALRLYNQGTVAEWSIREPAHATSDNLVFSKLVGATYSDYMTIDTSGNIGIGTTPSYKLDVAETGSARGLNVSNTYATGTAYAGYFSKTGAATTNVGLYATATGATNNYAAIFNAGNVGIGTTAPAYLLDASLNDDSTGILYIADLKRNYTNDSTSTRGTGLLFTDKNSQQATIVANRIDSTATYRSDLIFSTNNGGTGTDLQERMRILYNGAVGIGVTNPSYKLDLAETGSARGLNVSNTYATGTAYAGYFSKTGAATNNIGLYATASGAGTGNYAAIFDQGNVGIGITTPTFGLEVGGTARIDGNTTIGDASGDSLTVNAATLSLANASTLDLANSSINSLNIESGLMDFDTTNSRIGIGTTTPQQKLDLNGTSAFSQSFSNSTAQKVYLGLAFTSGDWITGSAANDFAVRTQGSNILFSTDSGSSAQLYLKNGGNVGIGNTAPISKLDVTGSVRLSSGILLTGGVSAIGDQESMVPNAGFEINDDATSTVGDAWTAVNNGTSSDAITTTSLQGTNSQQLSANTGLNSALIYSPCIPITVGRTYNLYSRALVNTTTTSGYNLYLEEYSSASNCSSRTSPTNVFAQSNVALATTAADKGATLAAVGAGLTWARVLTSMSNPNVTATATVDGIRLVPSALTNGVDLAENYPVNSNDNLTPGDLVTLDKSSTAQTAQVTKTAQANDPDIMGIVSTQPGITLDDGETYKKASIALSGRVPLKVSTINGVIKKGDRLTSSSIPGVAAKAVNTGMTIGIATEDYNASGIGKIITFINLTTFDPETVLTSTGDMHLTPSKDGVYHGNLAEDTNEINSTSFSLTDSAGNVITKIGAFSGLIAGNIQGGLAQFGHVIINGTLVAKNATIETFTSVNGSIDNLGARILTINQKITSPIIETTNITATGTATLNEVDTNVIKPQENDVTIDLSGPTPTGVPNGNLDKMREIVIKGLNNQKVASIDAAGNATFSGTLAAKDASISGTLVAQNVDAQNIRDLANRTASNSGLLNQVSSQNSQLSTNVNDIQKLLNDIKNQPIPDPQYYQQLNPNTDYGIATEAANMTGSFNDLTGTSLTVTGQTTLYSVFVGNNLTAGLVSIQDNQVLALTSELRLSALTDINLLDGAVLVDRSGRITSKGAVVAEGGIETNSLKALHNTDNIAISLGTQTIPQTASSAAQIKNSEFQIKNNNGKEVASINASGSAQFKDIAINDSYQDSSQPGAVIAAAQNFQENGIYAPAIKTNSAGAGTGILPAGQQEIIVYNSNVTSKSLIYVTPTSATQNKSLFVATKKVGQYFTIAIDGSLPANVTFNWWIVN